MEHLSVPENLEQLKNIAMNHYRAKEYELALKVASSMGETRQGLEVLAYIYAYAPKYRNIKQVDPENQDSVVSKLLKIDSKNLTAYNAIIVYEIESLRQGGESLSWLDQEKIKYLTQVCLEVQDPQQMQQMRANILQNLARLLEQRGGDDETQQQALDFLGKSIDLYDQTSNYSHKDILLSNDQVKQTNMVAASSNLHHIAGAYFRRAQVSLGFGKADDMEAQRKAMEFGKIAEQLWQIISSNNANPVFNNNLVNTQKWLKDLMVKMK